MKILRETKLKDRTPEWFKFREDCMGASDGGKILNLNEYETAAEFLWKKSGFLNVKNSNNKFTHYGIELEDIIASRYWQYYDPASPNDIYDNAAVGRVIRTCRKLKGFTWREDFPILKASLDRVMGSDGFSILTGEKVKPRTPVEIKTIHPLVLKKYGGLPPPSYIVQVHAQMIGSGAEYGEIGALSDRDFYVFPIPEQVNVQHTIMEAYSKFWDLVVEAKGLKKDYDLACLNGNYTLADSIMERMDEITPTQVKGQEEPYKEFLDKRYREDLRKAPQTMGNKAILKVTKEFQYLKELEKHIKNEILFRRNEIVRFMGNTEQLLFENTDIRVSNAKQFRLHGSISYTEKASSDYKLIESEVVSIV